MEIIKVDLPYPSVEVEKDLKSAFTILPAYSNAHGELNAVLTYTYNGFYFNKLKLKQYYDVIEGIAVCEMEHLDLLGKLLLNLGLDPRYYYDNYGMNYYSASFVQYSTEPQIMLMDAISAELVAIKNYTDIIEKLSNDKVKAVIKRIKMDEELHVLTLKELLKEYGRAETQ